MFTRCVLYLATICYVATEINGQARVAIAHLVAENIAGSIRFAETDKGLHVTGTITGYNPGQYGFHIHELGDISNCDAAGMHFNPDGANHGGRDHDERHVGDLGNIEFVGDVATVDFVDSYIALRGRNSILGRALVLHAAKDDLGLGEDEASLVTGNAGARVACGVIGLLSPADPWNSAASVSPAAQLKLLTTFLFYFRS